MTNYAQQQVADNLKRAVNEIGGDQTDSIIQIINIFECCSWDASILQTAVKDSMMYYAEFIAGKWDYEGDTLPTPIHNIQAALFAYIAIMGTQERTQINIRCTLAEKAAIIHRASQREITVTDYLLNLAQGDIGETFPRTHRKQGRPWPKPNH